MTGKMKKKDNSGKDYDRKISCDSEKDIICTEYTKSKELVRSLPQIFCGQGTGVQFLSPDSPAAGIGAVTVDGRDLCKPLIKIKFSSIVRLTSADFSPEAQLTFSLFRSCDNEEPIFLDSWVYEAFQLDTSDPLGLTIPFTFIFCDHLNCSRMCDYFVQVSVGNLVNALVSVDNVQIQAIAHQRSLSCGQGMSAVFNGNNQDQPIIPNPSSAGLGQVTVNTDGFNKPVVEIEFSSIVNLIASSFNAIASLNFQLFRVCDEEEPVLVNNWIYEVFEIETSVAIRLSTSFSFIFCELLSLVKCCDYFIEVSVGGLESIDTISITDVHIAALAEEAGDCGKKALLSCDQGRGGAFTNTNMPPIIVGSVIIDTVDICEPRVSIEFSSIVSFLSTVNGAEGRLNFKLFRACDNGKPVLLNNWIYEVYEVESGSREMRFIDSFDFNYCDDMACTGCCEYFVEVTLENIITAVILVDNVHMTALAGEGL